MKHFLLCLILGSCLNFCSTQEEDGKIIHFLDYKDNVGSKEGWLYLKQDPRNPLYLPQQYTLCGHAFKFYDRDKYVTFATMQMLKDGSDEIEYEYTHIIDYHGRPGLQDHRTKSYPFIKKNGTRLKNPEYKTLKWYHLCFLVDFKNETVKVYLDGKQFGDATELYNNKTTHKQYETYGLYGPKGERQRFGLVLGTYRTEPQLMSQRMIGKLYGLHLYSELLDETTIENMAMCNYSITPGDILDWETAEWTSTNDEFISTEKRSLDDIKASVLHIYRTQPRNLFLGRSLCKQV